MHRYRVHIRPDRRDIHATPVVVVASSGDEAAVKARKKLHGTVYGVEVIGKAGGGRPKKEKEGARL